jgi:hypothetical protein
MQRSKLGAAALMLIAVASVCSVLAGPARADDDQDRHDLARQYLQLTHQLASARGIANAVGQQFIRKDPDHKLDVEDAIDQVVPKFKADVDDMNDAVIDVYATRFSADELKSMVKFYSDFYKTPAGAKLQKEHEEITSKLTDISRSRGVTIGGEIYQALFDKVNAMEQ